MKWLMISFLLLLLGCVTLDENSQTDDRSRSQEEENRDKKQRLKENFCDSDGGIAGQEIRDLLCK